MRWHSEHLQVSICFHRNYFSHKCLKGLYHHIETAEQYWSWPLSHLLLVRVLYLCWYISVLFPVTIHVVSVDIVGSWHAIHRLQDYSGVIICYDISVSILWLVIFQVRVIPCELLTRLDALVFLWEFEVIMISEMVDMRWQLCDGYWGMILHAYRRGKQTSCVIKYFSWFITERLRGKRSSKLQKIYSQIVGVSMI